MEKCSCGGELGYKKCCEPYHKGKLQPSTAEALMRARYSAFVHGDIDFIMNTIHPDHREGCDREDIKSWAKKSDWQGLEICKTKAGGEADTEGEVEFTAKYRLDDKDLAHHEIGRFQKSGDKWFFVDGKVIPQGTVVRAELKVGRNDPCPCGSGKKFKKCCA